VASQRLQAGTESSNPASSNRRVSEPGPSVSPKAPLPRAGAAAHAAAPPRERPGRGVEGALRARPSVQADGILLPKVCGYEFLSELNHRVTSPGSNSSHRACAADVRSPAAARARFAFSAVRTSRLARSAMSVSSETPFSPISRVRQMRLMVSSNTIPAMTPASFFHADGRSLSITYPVVIETASLASGLVPPAAEVSKLALSARRRQRSRRP
jgi:hypothetical protein